MFLRDTELAITWVEKAELPEEKRQVLLFFSWAYIQESFWWDAKVGFLWYTILVGWLDHDLRVAIMDAVFLTYNVGMGSLWVNVEDERLYCNLNLCNTGNPECTSIRALLLVWCMIQQSLLCIIFIGLTVLCLNLHRCSCTLKQTFPNLFIRFLYIYITSLHSWYLWPYYLLKSPQEMLRRLRSLYPLKDSKSSLRPGTPEIEERGRGDATIGTTSSISGSEQLSSAFKDQKTLNGDITKPAISKASHHSHLLERLVPCFWWYRTVTLKFGNARFVLTQGRIVLWSTFILFIYYLFRSKGAAFKR